MQSEILIVDDEHDIRAQISGILEDEGYATRTAKDGASALQEIEKAAPNLILMDVWLNDSRYDGLSLLDIIHQSYPHIPVVMISGHGTVETAVNSLKKGAYDFVEKPFNTDRLLLVVRHGLENARLKQEIHALQKHTETPHHLVGHSPEIQQLNATIDKMAVTSGRVLITGPLGSGKERVARAIHGKSPRATAPFVVVNCLTSEDALERDLFGSEKRGTTPAAIGALERAHRGTLYLDEISEMPLELQAKLVRVLQDGRFQRQGGTQSLQADVRIIAGTGCDLKERIQEKSFREDLYYRLAVVTLEIPALNRRRQDIPDLLIHFMETQSRASGIPPRTLSPEALMVLQAYDWPGNIRQLKNAIEWVLIMSQGDPSGPITPEMLPREITEDSKGNLSLELTSFLTAPLRDARETFERQYLLAQVCRFDGNISRTAEFIGMERSALHRKLRSLGVSQGDGHEDSKSPIAV